MALHYTPTTREQAGLDKRRAAYNSGQTPENRFNESEFLLNFAVLPLLRQFADEVDPETTNDIEALRDAIVADPTATRQAILKRRHQV